MSVRFSKPFLQCAVFLAALVIAFSAASPYFFSIDNFLNIFLAASILSLLALGSTFVIAAGGVDLSAGAVMALSGVIAALLLKIYNMPVGIALIGALLTGAICGGISASLINFSRAPSFIITLGMMSVARAFGLMLLGGVPIYSLSEAAVFFGQGRIATIPMPVLFLIAASAIAGLVLHQTKLGAHALALGDRPETAKAVKINVPVLRVYVFALAGVFSGLAGFLFMARTNAGDPSAGTGYELMAITAVLLGGANLYGGRANVFGTILGALCLGVLQNGLNLLAVGTFYQVLFVGLVLIGAALLRRGSEEA